MTNEKLVAKIQNGYSVTENMETLYRNLLPLIKSISKRYSFIEDMEDLIQQAYLGLYEAVQKYDSSENVPFMSYAEYWIRHSIGRYVEKYGSLVRIPNYLRMRISRYKKSVAHLEQKEHRKPTDEEISCYMGITVPDVREITLYMQDISSLDSPVNDEESLTMGDIVKSDFDLEGNFIDEIYQDYQKEVLWNIVEEQTHGLEKEIIYDYFLNRKSLPAIAKERGLTYDKVRTMRDKGLKQLKMSKIKKRLLEELEYHDSYVYRGGPKWFKENGESIVESIVIRKNAAVKHYNKIE